MFDSNEPFPRGWTTGTGIETFMEWWKREFFLSKKIVTNFQTPHMRLLLLNIYEYEACLSSILEPIEWFTKKKTKIIFCSPTKCNQSREIDCLRFSESPAEPGQNLHCRSRRAKWSQIDSSGNGHHLPLHDKRDDFGLFSATTGRFGSAINSVEIAGFRLFGVIFSHTRVCRVFSFF